MRRHAAGGAAFRRLRAGAMAGMLAAGLGCDRLFGPSETGPAVPSPMGAPPTAALVERVGEVAVVRLIPDGWNALNPRQRILAWHLTRAALAGRDIIWDQNHRHGLAVRRLMEGLYRRRADLDAALAGPLEEYTKRLWINNGFYVERTRRKFVPTFSPADLRRAVDRALEAGATAADLGLPDDTTPAARLASLERTMFDPEFEPLVTLKSGPPGTDLIAGSAVNFYSDVSLADVEIWAAGGGEHHPLNARVVRRDGRIAEEIWRAGSPDGSVPPGLYATELRRVIAHLEAALPWADDKQAEALRRLVAFYQTGSPEDWRAFNRAWLLYDRPVVDTINGFIEVYRDPRGLKGTWEGIVHIPDPEGSRILAALAAAARYFEAAAPWDKAFKRESFTLPVAGAVNVIMATGDGGPSCALGVNLPNEEDLREVHGSKSVTLANVLRAWDAALTGAALDEFALPEEREEARRWGPTVVFLQTSLHEVLGHASGAVLPEIGGRAPEKLRQHYNAIEEARAELVALHHLRDPKLVEIGALPSADAVRAAYRAYARAGLLLLRRVRAGTTIEDDHMRATALIVHYLMDAGSIERVTRDGRTYYQVVDEEQMREGIAALLAELQRIKATGDYAAADRLMRAWAIDIDPELRDEVVRRATEAGVPDMQAALMPRLEPILGPRGDVVDVRVLHDEDLATQMLRFSAPDGAP